jgi:hypothetical protein
MRQLAFHLLSTPSDSTDRKDTDVWNRLSKGVASQAIVQATNAMIVASGLKFSAEHVNSIFGSHRHFRRDELSSQAAGEGSCEPYEYGLAVR